MKSPSPASTPRTGNPARWLHLAPRYLGRMAHGLHLLDSDGEFAARFSERVRQAATHSEIASAVEIHSYSRGQRDEFRIAPAKP